MVRSVIVEDMITAFRMDTWNGFQLASGLAGSLFSANSALSPRNWFSLSRLHYIITVYK